MTDWFSTQGKKLLEMKLGIAWFCIFTLGSLCSCIIAALQGVEWEKIDHQARFLIVVAIILNLSNTIGAFINQAITKLSKGQNPLPGVGNGGSTPPMAGREP